MIYDILCIVYYTLIRLPFLSTQNFHTKASRRSHYQLVHGVLVQDEPGVRAEPGGDQ